MKIKSNVDIFDFDIFIFFFNGLDLLFYDMIKFKFWNLEDRFLIVIIGGGIGGLVLVIVFIKRNVFCIVYEVGDFFVIVGVGIGLGLNSFVVFDLIDF